MEEPLGERRNRSDVNVLEGATVERTRAHRRARSTDSKRQHPPAQRAPPEPTHRRTRSKEAAARRATSRRNAARTPRPQSLLDHSKRQPRRRKTTPPPPRAAELAPPQGATHPAAERVQNQPSRAGRRPNAPRHALPTQQPQRTNPKRPPRRKKTTSRPPRPPSSPRRQMSRPAAERIRTPPAELSLSRETADLHPAELRRRG